jgi:hypothetical protein
MPQENRIKSNHHLVTGFSDSLTVAAKAVGMLALNSSRFAAPEPV